MAVVEVASRHGRFLVEINDRYIGRSLFELGEYAEAQVELFRQYIKPGMVVVDAGANVGAHTIAFAKMGAKVHAYEPQRYMFYLLCGNIALNGLSMNIEAHRQALGNSYGFPRIPILDPNRENNFGAFSMETKGVLMDTVEMTKLTQRCDFLKIDVEGYELEVLKGAKEMIEAYHPILYVENDRKEKSAELIAFIRNLGYTPYHHITSLDNENNFNGSEYRIGCQSVDLLCVTKGTKVEGLVEA